MKFAIIWGPGYNSPVPIDFATLDVGREDETELERDLRKVYIAARDGQAVMLYTILKEQEISQLKYLLTQPYQDVVGQNCPLLVIAARNGHDKVVKTLISKVKAFLNMYHNKALCTAMI